MLKIKNLTKIAASKNGASGIRYGMDSFDLCTWDLFSSAGGLLSKPTLIDQVVIDSRRIDSKHSLFVALKGKKEDGHRFIEHAAKNERGRVQ